jgi:DNA-binding transcriptional regulator of glucitol operon
VARSYRFAASPGWLAGHLLVIALAVTMVFLGRWQLDVSNSKGFSLQNFGYALQWWAFSVFGVGLWLKVLRDNAARSPSSQPAPAPVEVPEPVEYRRYVMPESAHQPQRPTDALHADYNDYLASLAARDAAEQRGAS